MFKKVFLFFAFIFRCSQLTFSQESWSFDDGYNNGYLYHQLDRRDMLDASVEFALSIGEIIYAHGLLEGWNAYVPP